MRAIYKARLPQTYSVQNIADAFYVHPVTVRRWARRGILRRPGRTGFTRCPTCSTIVQQVDQQTGRFSAELGRWSALCARHRTEGLTIYLAFGALKEHARVALADTTN